MSTPVKKVPIHLQSSQNRLLLKHGKIVNADSIQDADVYIEDGVIKDIGRNLIIPGGTRVLEVRGMYVMPGGIDPHTHLETESLTGHKSCDDYYQGTRSAISGGTTMIMDFVQPQQGESLLEAYDRVRDTADPKVCCDYALHVCLAEWSDQIEEEMLELCESRGINSFKMFMAFKDELMLRDSELYRAFKKCKELGSIPMVHAENGDIIDENVKLLIEQGISGPEGHDLSRSEIVEAEAVNRACVIANQVQSPVYIDGLTCKSAADVISKFQGEPKVIGAVMASSLGIDVVAPSVTTVTCPPLRSNSSLHLIQLLADGFLQVSGSGHCTFTQEQKNEGANDFRKIPPGVNGLEDRMSIIWEKGVESGAMDPTQFVAITSTNAARIFNIYPKKGCIQVGSDADVVVWNHSKTRTISAGKQTSLSDINIYEGMVVHGVPEYVIFNGRICVEEGDVKPVQGFGSFLPTKVFPPYLYSCNEGDVVNGEGKEDEKEKVCNQNEDSFNSKRASLQSDENECGLNIGEVTPNKASGKAMRQEGQRNLQDSTFSISKELNETERRSCIRVCNPPGGQSSGGFW